MRSAPATLLLAHHGTDGAKRAEAQAFALASPGVTRIVHLYVVPEFWAGMQGDDWLNNAWTRDAFAVHVERQLDAEATAEVDALAARCMARGLSCGSLVRFGEPAECLLAAAREVKPELVVIGPPRPKGAPGYRSRMDLEKLARGLAAPLLVAR
ncbi:MAG: universal stress protein [Rhodocyclaceae bacterium]|nr:universal stress protein [Rhodocyclaceae bacterium]